jgi:hypothetical protein
VEKDSMLNDPQRGLTPEKLQLFVASLSGLHVDEVRKAKLLFLKNELSQLRALKSTMAGIGVAQGCFAIIPIFWPILWAQRRGMDAAVTLHKDQIRNALSVWGEDLGEAGRQIESELATL